MPKEFALVYPQPDFTFQVVSGRPFHTLLKDAREKKGLGVRELARRIGCSHVHLLNMELGKKIPSPERLNQLQKELELEPFFLIPTKDLFRLDVPEIGYSEEMSSPSFLFFLLLEALRKGGFDPVMRMPSPEDREGGICARIGLRTTSRYEILVRELT